MTIFYFIIGEIEEKDLKEFKNVKDLHLYIIENTFQITTNYEKAKKVVDDNTNFSKNMGILDRIKNFFITYPKYWKFFEIKSNLKNYNPREKFYINKSTLDITQLKPSEENKKDFIEYKLESWCGTNLINGCDED